MAGLTRQQYLVMAVVAIAVFSLLLSVWWRQSASSPGVDLEALPAEEETEQNGEESFPDRVVVHVAGEVKDPGVFTLDTGSRVQDALMAAGGGTEEAEVHALNLAAELVDGQRVYVPRVGEVEETMGLAAGSDNQRVNLNTASLDELETLPGIGPALAQRIVDHREANGLFRNIEEIKEVSGIGDKRFADMEERISAP